MLSVSKLLNVYWVKMGFSGNSLSGEENIGGISFLEGKWNWERNNIISTCLLHWGFWEALSQLFWKDTYANCGISRLAGKFAGASLNAHLLPGSSTSISSTYSQTLQKRVFTSFLFKAAHSGFETIWVLESSAVHQAGNLSPYNLYLLALVIPSIYY